MAQFAWGKCETHHKARESIMTYVLQFCITRYWPDKNSPSIGGFTPEHGETKAQVGDLVLLDYARGWTKWNIGWLREVNPWGTCPEFVLESLEDGELCNWSNISLSFMPRKELECHPDWRWSDQQFAFRDRWNRVCYKDRDAYINLPVPPIFGEGYSVTLGTRTRHGFDDKRPVRSFPDWRKVTKAMMAQCYDDCVAEKALNNA